MKNFNADWQLQTAFQWFLQKPENTYKDFKTGVLKQRGEKSEK